MKKFFFLALGSILLVGILFLFTKYYGKKVINNLPISVSLPLKNILKDNVKKNTKRISNDYNEVFLPKTQFNQLNFNKIKLDFLKLKDEGYLKSNPQKSFFIEKYNDKIYLADKFGNFYYDQLKNIKTGKINFNKISTNLGKNKNEVYIKTLDIHLADDKIYFSKVVKKGKCKYLLVDVAEINLEKLNFKNIFTSENNNECMSHSIWAGKMEVNDSKNLLITTSGDHLFVVDKDGKKVLRENEFDTKPQDNKSIFGKVLLIDTKSFKYEIFNKGHRNSIGLLVEKDLIISTENGPRGGDEINIEKKGGNYGWNDASYGKKYFSEGMFLDHETAGFEEPVFTFIPSLAITEIIRLNNNFTEEWQDNYLIGSLNGRHLLRLKFNKEKSKVLYIEKIFIGERIRDLLYDEKNKIILLALEETGSIGVISK